MKRTVITVLVALSLVGVSSEDTLAQGFSLGDFGIKAGIGLSKLSGEPDSDSPVPNIEFDNDVGFVGGFFLVGHFSRRVAVQAEVLYMTRKTETPTNTLDADFIHVPVLLTLYTSASDNSPKVFAGPAVSYRLDTTADGGVNPLVNPIDIDDEVKDSFVEIVVGAGIDIDRNFQLDARYVFGVENFFVDEKAVDYKWRQFVFTAGYVF